MEITSPAFEHHQTIPKKYTCDGEDVSPPLSFISIPTGTKSLALIVEDPDAPSGTFDHWIVWNIPQNTNKLPESYKAVRQGKNHFGKTGYGGPCPPRGPAHRYFFKLYALDLLLDLPDGSDKEDLEEAMKGHTLGQTELVGTYGRG